MSAVSLIQELADTETARRLRTRCAQLRLARASGLIDGLHRIRRPAPPQTERERRAYERGYSRGQAIWEGSAR